MPVSHLDPASCLPKSSISCWPYVNELWDLIWQTAHTGHALIGRGRVPSHKPALPGWHSPPRPARPLAVLQSLSGPPVSLPTALVALKFPPNSCSWSLLVCGLKGTLRSEQGGEGVSVHRAGLSEGFPGGLLG